MPNSITGFSLRRGFKYLLRLKQLFSTLGLGGRFNFPAIDVLVQMYQVTTNIVDIVSKGKMLFHLIQRDNGQINGDLAVNVSQ